MSTQMKLHKANSKSASVSLSSRYVLVFNKYPGVLPSQLASDLKVILSTVRRCIQRDERCGNVSNPQQMLAPLPKAPKIVIPGYPSVETRERTPSAHVRFCEIETCMLPPTTLHNRELICHGVKPRDLPLTE